MNDTDQLPATTEENPAPAASDPRLSRILEALLLAADAALSLDTLQRLLGEEFAASRSTLRQALAELKLQFAQSAAELIEVSGGWRLQVRAEFAAYVSRLWQEKPPKMTRAALETLALIVYRQPITRGEIEDIRGVAVSSNILRSLSERGWIKELGVKEVPGRPTLFGSTGQFLDDFGLKSVEQLPALPEIQNPEQLERALARLVEGDSPPAPDGIAPEQAPDIAAPPADATFH